MRVSRTLRVKRTAALPPLFFIVVFRGSGSGSGSGGGLFLWESRITAPADSLFRRDAVFVSIFFAAREGGRATNHPPLKRRGRTEKRIHSSWHEPFHLVQHSGANQLSPSSFLFTICVLVVLYIHTLARPSLAHYFNLLLAGFLKGRKEIELG